MSFFGLYKGLLTVLSDLSPYIGCRLNGFLARYAGVFLTDKIVFVCMRYG